MFDWNDEELSDIIWGEARENDDHIVPYPNGNEDKQGLHGDQDKKDGSQADVDLKYVEQKKPDGVDVESIAKYNTNEGVPTAGYNVESWQDLPISNGGQSNQDSLRTDASNNLFEASKHESIKDDTPQLDSGSEFFQNRLEDGEQGDFVDYGWANIGSFDDLDRIFSNDDPVFGHGTLGNSDELWTTSRDVISSPENSVPLSTGSASMGLGSLKGPSGEYECKVGQMLDQNQPFAPEYKTSGDIPSNDLENAQTNINHLKFAGDQNSVLVNEKTAIEASERNQVQNSQFDHRSVATPNENVDKGNRKKSLKSRRKSEEKVEIRQLQDLPYPWPQSGNQIQLFGSQYAPTMCQTYPTSLLSPQSQLQGSRPGGYLNFHGPLLASSAYGNMTNQYPQVPVLHQLHSGEGNRQPIPSSCEVSPGNSGRVIKSSDALVKPPTMTPQEKIEKLRRRQQMRAILAIQKQQQQFSSHVSSTECSNVEGANVEIEDNLNAPSVLDPTSPAEQDDSTSISTAIDDCSVEDSVLYQLQDIISKLDIRIRLCIRDSLFRLAQSATQRQYASDTSSTSKSNMDEVFSKEEINNNTRFSRTPNVETETNPIDRTVAHLLFHRPMEFSGKFTEMPESPISAKLSFERKTMGPATLPTESLPMVSETKTISYQGSETITPFLDGDQSDVSPCLKISEDVSTEAANVAVGNVEASN